MSLSVDTKTDLFTSHPPVPFGGCLTPKLAPCVELSSKYSEKNEWRLARIVADATVIHYFFKLLDTHECDVCNFRVIISDDDLNDDSDFTEPSESFIATSGGEEDYGDPGITDDQNGTGRIAVSEPHNRFKSDQLVVQFDRARKYKPGVPIDTYLVKFVETQRAIRLAKYSRTYFESCMTKESFGAAVTVGGSVLSYFQPDNKSNVLQAMKWTFGSALLAHQCLAVNEYAKTPSVRVRTERNDKFEHFCKLQISRKKDLSELDFFEGQFNKNRKNNRLSVVDLSLNLGKYFSSYKEKANKAAEKYQRISFAKVKFEEYVKCEIEKEELEKELQLLEVQIHNKEESLKKSRDFDRKAIAEYAKQTAKIRLPKTVATTVIVDGVSTARTERLEQALTELQKTLACGKWAVGKLDAKSSSELNSFKSTTLGFQPREMKRFNASVAPYLLLIQYVRCKDRLDSDTEFKQVKDDLIRVGVDDLLINGFEDSPMLSIIDDYEKRKAEEALGIETEYVLPEAPTHLPGQRVELGDAETQISEELIGIVQEYNFPDAPTTTPGQSLIRPISVLTSTADDAAQTLDGTTSTIDIVTPAVNEGRPILDEETPDVDEGTNIILGLESQVVPTTPAQCSESQ